MRAVPASNRRASFLVDSWVWMVPSFGRVDVVPVQRIGSAESRNESRHLPRFLNFGNPSRRPLRSAFFDLMNSVIARSRSRNASWEAHLEFSGHQAKAGSAFLTAFQSLCSSGAVYQRRSAAYRSLHRASPQFHANRAAPACDRNVASCARVGSSVNLYAWMTFMARSPLTGAGTEFTGVAYARSALRHNRRSGCLARQD